VVRAALSGVRAEAALAQLWRIERRASCQRTSQAAGYGEDGIKLQVKLIRKIDPNVFKGVMVEDTEPSPFRDECECEKDEPAVRTA